MFGMVNNAFRAYVIETEGHAAWQDIVDRAALRADEFSAMAPYDDAVTLSIIGSMAEQSGRTVDDVLRDVGRYWVTFAKTTSFANLLAMIGRDFATVIASLDQMHARIQTSLPTLRPPAFSCRECDDGLVEVTYVSAREGLFPFVLGILEGLSAEFGQEIEVVTFETLSAYSAKWTLRCHSVAEDNAA